MNLFWKCFGEGLRVVWSFPFSRDVSHVPDYFHQWENFEQGLHFPNTLPYWSIQLCEFLDCKLYSISTATATGRNKTVPKVQWTWALSAFANNLIPSYDLSTNCERESYLYQSSLETAVIRSFNLWKIQAMIGLRSVKNCKIGVLGHPLLTKFGSLVIPSR